VVHNIVLSYSAFDFDALSYTLYGIQLNYIARPYNPMVTPCAPWSHHGTPLFPTAMHGIPWCSTKHHGIQMNFMVTPSLVKKKILGNTMAKCTMVFWGGGTIPPWYTMVQLITMVQMYHPKNHGTLYHGNTMVKCFMVFGVTTVPHCTLKSGVFRKKNLL
jgi:hypothetical protein